jgi:hypothetical protein
MTLRIGARRTVMAAGILVAVVAPTAAAAATHTRASIDTPVASSGAPTVHVASTVRGHCWIGSLAAARSDAWRCLTGNLIYDPCFSSPSAPGIVLCPASGPWTPRAIKIKLTAKLPTKYANPGRPSTTGLPWALVTTSGWRCRLATGATSVVQGRRANYVCTGTKDWLWGAASRRSEPWKILVAPASANKLKRTVGIRSAWF